MAEWLYEAGIGEERAALVEDGAILEARITPDSDSAKAGAICGARLVEVLSHKRAGRLVFDSGEGALLQPLPKSVTEGEVLFVRIAREAIAEPGRSKLAIASHAPNADEARPAPTLRERLAMGDAPVADLAAHGTDRLEEAGWSELLEQAAGGAVPFPGGALRIALTPAMCIIDVDGALPPAELAIAGARAAAEAIRRLDIAGNIGIDLPTLEAKADRQAAAEAFDGALPQPFERTAVNGFGFLQIVRRKTHASLPQLAQYNSTAFFARALMRQAERAVGKGVRTLTAHPAIVAHLEKHPDWLAECERRIGAPLSLAADASLALTGGYVSASNP